MEKSKNISWMPLFVIAAAAFVGALDATFMNVSMSQVVIDLDTSVGTIQKMVSFYQDAMGLVMIVAVGLMVLGIILAVSLNDVKKQKSGENE